MSRIDSESGAPLPSEGHADPTWPLVAPRRPAFFPGQLLTAADLDALASWGMDRLALLPHHLGSGVVVGLEVSAVAGDPEAVRIEPGYALDGHGRAIVVPAPDIRRLEALAKAAGLELARAAEWDLFACAREKRVEPRRTAQHDGMGAQPLERFARILETYELSLRPAEERDRSSGAHGWDEAWRRSLDAVRTLGHGWIDAAEPAVRERLVQALDGAPLRYVLGVGERLQASEGLDGREARLLTALWIVLDRRIALGLTGSPRAAGLAEVRLARLHLGRDSRASFIDTLVPTRQSGGIEQAGNALSINLAGVVGLTPQDADRWLAARGLRSLEKIPLNAGGRRSPGDVRRLLDRSPYATTGDRVALVTLHDTAHTLRVVGAHVADAHSRTEPLERTDPTRPAATTAPARPREREVVEVVEVLREEPPIQAPPSPEEPGVAKPVAAAWEELVAVVEASDADASDPSPPHAAERRLLQVEQTLLRWDAQERDVVLLVSTENGGAEPLVVEFTAPQFDLPLARLDLPAFGRHSVERILRLPLSAAPSAASTIQAVARRPGGGRVLASSTFALAVRPPAPPRAWWAVFGRFRAGGKGR